MPDTLIYAMSTRGCMRLEQFNDLFRHVYFPANMNDDDSVEIDARRRTVRMLDSLGFCEFDYDNRLVYMCKPSMILLPVSGLPVAALIGARTPRLVKDLKDSVKNRKDRAVFIHYHFAQEDITIPDVLTVEAADRNTLLDIAQEIHVSHQLENPPAWELANMSASINDVRKNIRFEYHEGINWKRRIFSTDKLVFDRYIMEPSKSFLAEYRNPIDQQLQHWYWNDGRAALINRDWGRYLSMEDDTRHVLLYDEQRHKLAVPVTTPLPCILARALSLCTAQPPQSMSFTTNKTELSLETHAYQVYQGINPVIASLVAAKLGQQLNYTPIEITRGGVLNA